MEAWSRADTIAALALAVAAAALLISLIPAVSSVAQVWIAHQSLKAEREAREPALNTTIVRIDAWQPGFVCLQISLRNRSDFIIEAQTIEIVGPRDLKIAHMNVWSLAELPIDLSALSFSRKAHIEDFTIAPLGSKQGWPAAEYPSDERTLLIALSAPEKRWKSGRIRMVATIARSNRQIAPSFIAIHVEIDKKSWTYRPVRRNVTFETIPS